MTTTRRRLELALDNCPHWDLTFDGLSPDNECCLEVDDARHSHRQALRLLKEEKDKQYAADFPVCV